MMCSAVAAALLVLLGPAPGPGSHSPGSTVLKPAMPGAPAAMRLPLVPAPDGNEARFKVREQLAELALPNVAVGVTSHITGAIVLEDGGFTGMATTRVKFEDFGMTQPRVAIVLCVEDDIGLEYQFHLVPEAR